MRLISLFLILVACMGCQKQKVPERLFPVEVAPVTCRNLPIILTGVGHLLASEEVEIHPQVDGVITRVHFEDGQYVEKGKLLIEIDDRKYAACVEEGEAKVLEEQARYRYALAVTSRMAELVSKDYVSVVEYESKVKETEEGKQRLEEAKAALKRCQVNLEHTKITSPINGYLNQRRYDPGNYVTAHDDSLVTIRNVSPMVVDFSLPALHLDTIREKQKNTPLSLSVQRCVEGSCPLEGFLTFIQNRVHPETGMLQLRGQLPNYDEKGWPGEFVRVSLKLDEKINSCVVPHNALVLGQDAHFLFVLSPDQQRVERRKVKVGVEFEGVVEILEGVEKEELVIVDGQLNLFDQAPVKVVSSKQVLSSHLSGLV